MDKMCQKLEVDDLNNTLANSGQRESLKRCESPVFKCINQTKPMRTNHLGSSDYDIPSYEINQTARNKSSSKNGNVTSEAILPLSPIFTTVTVAELPPSSSTSSLVTFEKNLDKTWETNLPKFPAINRTESLKPCRIFESLGMTDKDISWVSSMASPPPKQVPGSEFNTVEKATFFPEEKFQSIQPRALFSPTFDEDFGCHPITFTSESGDDDEAYKSNIRLSDVCATLKQLEVKSLDQLADSSVKKIITEEEGLSSPVLRAEKKKKLDSVKKKKKGALIISPEGKDKYEFSVNEDFEVTNTYKVKSNGGNNFIEDDSFQSMSFSCIDELCKTVVIEQSNSSSLLNSNHCDGTLMNNIDIHSKANNTKKKFYLTKSTTEIFFASSINNLHSYAKALEEGDKSILGDSKIDKSFIEKGIVRFDIFQKDFSKIDALKKLHSEMTAETDDFDEKEYKKIDKENSSWEKAKQYLSESQLNVSDSEIFRTMENLEKTLASQESKDMDRLSDEGRETALPQNSTSLKVSQESLGETEEKASKINSKDFKNLLEIYKVKTCNTEDSSLNLLSVPCAAFSTASGSKILISEKALTKAKEFLKDCIEDLENADSHKLENFNRCNKQVRIAKNTEIADDPEKKMLMTGFSIGSGKEIKTSVEFSEKAEVFTASGKQIQISDEALKKAKILMSECDEIAKQDPDDVSGNQLEGFSTGRGEKIQGSAKTLEKAKVVMANYCEEEDVKGMKGCITDFGKQIQMSECSSAKTKAVMSEHEGFKKNSGSGSFQKQTTIMEKPASCDPRKPDEDLRLNNFLTASGKSIQVSSEALEKAKVFMKNCETEFNENANELNSVWMKELNDQDFCSCKGDKTKENVYNTTNKNSPTKERNSKKSEMSFSTALGREVKVSRKAIEKAKAFWSKSDEIASEMPENFAQEFFQAEPFFTGFETANESKLTVEDVLTKPKEKMFEGNQKKTECDRNFDCITDENKTSLKSVSETFNFGENSRKLLTTAGIDESNGWDEIIPSWLHVYNTSPSMTSDRTDLSPFISHEDGNLLKSHREYLVKSPVLGSGDRFYGKKRRRKLRFEGDEKFDNKTSSGFVVPFKSAGPRINMKRTSNLSLDFSVPFKKMKFVEDINTAVVDVRARRMHAREEQEKIIKEKERVKPLKGSYLIRKCSERQMSWMEAVAGSTPEVHPLELLRSFDILEEVLQITVETAISFRFNAEDFFGSNCEKNVEGIPLGDGCLLILDDENKFGVEEVKRAFLASPGVQPNLVPHGWVENHFKWIVWKLAHYERSFPQYFGRRCLTPNHLMLQLKYRYDREIDRNERSALKKILERDDTSVKRLALCVCGIKKVTVGETSGYELNLTDGWYSCPARSDPAMARLIEDGKLHIGTKLLTQGATLLNCEQGVSPLEMGDDVYLKISTNSTRRIRWDTKLGFQKNPKNFPISLGSILPQGGQISRIDVIIVRIYPMLYLEKTSDGHHVTRNRRSEEKAAADYRRIQEQRMEVIFDEIQSELRKSAKYEKKFKKNNLINIEQDVGLSQFLEANSDLSDLQNALSSEQKTLLEKLRSNEDDRFSREVAEKIEKKLEKEKPRKRNVSEFLRAKIVDFRKPDYNNPAILSVWNPSEDLTAMLSEGKVISLLNVTVSNSSRMYKPLQINTTRQTQFREVPKTVKYPTRKLTHLKDVSSKICPAFEEVDVVGMVAHIQDLSYGSRLSQIVYLTDFEMNFIGIVFWGNCKDYGWENVLRIPSIVACSNLQWKKNENSQDVPSLYVNENSVFTENPRHDYLKEEMERLKQNQPQDINAFISKCEEDLTTKLDDSKWRSKYNKKSSSSLILKETCQKTCLSVNGFESKPTASSTPIKPFSFEKNSGEPEPSPIQKKIEKLQCYGEPPSLIPLLIKNNARRKYQKKSVVSHHCAK